jgi:hypothetical protein
MVAERLCKFSRNHKITFQYALWDLVKSVEASKIPVRRMSNHAILFGFLIRTHCLSLAALKSIDFSTITSKTVSSSQSRLRLFLQMLVVDVLFGHDHGSGEIEPVFARLKASPHVSDIWLGEFMEFVQVMLVAPCLKGGDVLLLCRRYHPGMSDAEIKSALKERVKTAKKTLLQAKVLGR